MEDKEAKIINAITNNNLTELKQFLSHLDDDQLNESVNTWLMYASISLKTDIVRHLLSIGANSKFLYENGQTPISVMKHFIDFVKEKKANPLDKILAMESSREILELLEGANTIN